MKVQYGATNFTGGELSPRLDGRPDVAKQRNGLRVCENFQVVVHGGLRKRSGTQFVCELSNGESILHGFNYSTEDSYMLLFGSGYMWVAKDRGLVAQSTATITGITKASTGVVETSSPHGFSTGDAVLLSGIGGMTELNNRVVRITVLSPTTFAIAGLDSVAINTTAYTTFSSGGSASKIVEVTTPYSADELQELRFAQYNDVLYITHKDHALRKISRVSNTSWTIETVSITTGPFRNINGNSSRVMRIAGPRSWSISNITRANPAVVTVTSTAFLSVGDQCSFGGIAGMTQLNGNVYDVTEVNGLDITISVNSSSFGVYAGGGVIGGAPGTIWGTYPVGAKLFLDASWGPFTTGHVGSLWRLSESGSGTAIQGPPLGDAGKPVIEGILYTSGGNIYGVSGVTGGAAFNWSQINRVPEHESGTVRLLGVSNYSYGFNASFLHPGYCVVQVTDFVSATRVGISVVRYQVPQSVIAGGTSFWEEGAWSVQRGFPRCCAFFEQRLWAAGSDSEPTVLWGSRSSGFENFEDGPDDDDAITYRASSGYADTIRWLSGGRVLVAGTSHGEYAVAASNQNEALTPSNLRMLLQTTYGTSDAPPVRVNESVLYPQRNGKPDNSSRKLREFSYDFTADTFNSVDMTVFAEHVTGSGVRRLAYTMQPDPMIWAQREDGQLAVCTYERLQEVVAWQRHTMGGVDATVQALAVCPGLSGDDVWVQVTRTVDGVTRRYLEVFYPPFEPAIHAKEDGVFVDAALTYTGASTSTITGLWHLRGETVQVLNNGSVETGTVSSTGSLTLSRATTKAHVGLGYTSVVETQELEAGAQAGTAQGAVKRISQVRTRVLGSLGGTIGAPEDAGNLDPLRYRTEDDVMGSTPPLFSGLIENDFKGKHDREARIRIEHDDPLPFFVTAIVAEQATNG